MKEMKEIKCPKCKGTSRYLYEYPEHESRPYFEDECNECEDGKIWVEDKVENPKLLEKGK